MQFGQAYTKNTELTDDMYILKCNIYWSTCNVVLFLIWEFQSCYRIM